MLRKRTLIPATALAIGALVVAQIAGCIRLSGGPPEVLVFDYRVLDAEDPAALAASLSAGSTTIADRLGPTPCRFAASFSVNKPRLSAGGAPGDAGYNVTVSGAGLINVSTTTPTDCIGVSDLRIMIGALSERLALGQTATMTVGDITLSDGRRMKERVYFEAVVESHNPSTGRVTGRFRLASNEALRATTILIAEGSFGMR